MRVLSVDPGFERVGIAILDKINGKEILIHSECFKTKKELAFSERLRLIGEKIEEIAKNFNPNFLAIETLFFTTNQKTAMKVSEARGVIIYSSVKNKMEIFEYTPLQIKIAVTGYGKATKDQVEDMTKKILKIKNTEKKIDDEMDAIAIGICHFAYQKNYPQIK